MEQSAEREEVEPDPRVEKSKSDVVDLELEDGTTLLQRYPRSIGGKHQFKDLLAQFQRNLRDILTLNDRMRCLNKLHQKRVDEFNRHTQQRIERAIEIKKG